MKRAGILATFAPVALASLVLGPGPGPRAGGYDPERVDLKARTERIDLSVRDEARKRDIPLRVYLPPSQRPAPVVLFSHGLGGTRYGCAYLGERWSRRGYLAVFVQHPGSDDGVWRQARPAERMAAMRRAASAPNLLARVRDIPAVLDALDRWSRQPDHRLYRRADMKRVGMSGHSFGAVTTQAIGGQSFGALGARFADSRVRAAIAFSPSAPRAGDPARAFGGVRIPWLLMTGTRDTSVITTTDAESRLKVFAALPPGSKYELVLYDAEHSAFADGALPGDRARRNPNHHRAIMAISTAFWDAYLREDRAARAWLDGEGPRSVLEAQDRWRTK